jgi:5-formyltetrahydrofolate cyclo-ligase
MLGQYDDAMARPTGSSGGDAQSRADAAAITDAKRVLRRAVRQRRSVRTEAERAADDTGRFEQLQGFLSGSRLRTAACYVSAPPEPGTLQLIAWLAAEGVRVLLPVLTAPVADGVRPDWAPYAGPDRLRTGRMSIIQPDTAPVGAPALAEAELIVLPGLAGNAAGHRLGRGGGWYDRALIHADPIATTVLLLNDDEVVNVIPTHPWDRSVDLIATPTRLLRTRHPSD